MPHLVIEPRAEGMVSPCALCGEIVAQSPGPRLAVARDGRTVCPDCGKRQAPALAALLQLADAAAHVGRIHRHTVFPPMRALLHLARAAEDYTHLSAVPVRKAG
jgi:hypothetical protein